MPLSPTHFREREKRHSSRLPRPRGWRRALRGLCAAALGGWLMLAAATGAEVTTEYEVKAALLYQFTQFVEWPPQAFSSRTAPLVIGVLGADPFGGLLDKLVEPEQGRRHPIEVMRCRNLDDARRCQLLFISSSERANLPQIVAALGELPVLTVADFDGFLRRGGMVQFRTTSRNKIHLRVNLANARARGLTFSSKLLRVVEIVAPEQE
jgi:hypothetical protein